ncbi:hypothetical protein N9L92_01830 [Saprospiraceae bacterium]|nr:hypothetical protein [Saprospiraceae bacterium]
MRIKFLIIVALSLLVSKNFIGQKNEKKIEKIFIAEYSPSRSGIILRADVFNKKQSSVQKFDEQNNLLEYFELNSSTKKIRNLYKYFYNQDQIVTLIEVYNNENELTSYTKQIINSFDKIDTSYTYLASKELSGIQIYNYDINNNLINRIDSSFKYNRTLKWRYEYNSLNEMTKLMAYDKYGLLRDTRNYKYNESGQEYESNLIKANGEFTFFKSKYNENGDLTDNIWYNKEGVIKSHTKFKYLYDEYGNWLTKVRSRDEEEPNYIWERKIEYYNR